MDRLMVVLFEDLNDKESYGFMAMPTPNQYAKKVDRVLYHENYKFVLKTKNKDLIEEILYQDIDKVKLSMCTRIIASSGIGGGLRTIAHIDMDIIQKNGSISLYEVVRPDSMDMIFSLLHDKKITIEDPIGIEAIYKKIDGVSARSKYLTGNFGKYARKFKLDHPRRPKK